MLGWLKIKEKNTTNKEKTSDSTDQSNSDV